MQENILLLYKAGKQHLERLRKIAPGCSIFASVDANVIQKQIVEATIVMGNHHLCESIPLAKQLKWVQTNSVGVDTILRKTKPYLKSVILTNAKGVYDAEMSEHTMALLFALHRQIPQLVLQQHNGIWKRNGYLETLENKCVVIVGYGSLGKAVAHKLKPFGCRIYGVHSKPGYIDVQTGKIVRDQEWQDLLPLTDFLILCLPSTQATRNLISAKELAQLSQQCSVINVGRPETIDQHALIDQLQKNKIKSAALDVFLNEPIPPDDPIWKIPNLLISPHTARSQETQAPFRFEPLFENNLNRFIQHMPLLNQVNMKKGY